MAPVHFIVATTQPPGPPDPGPQNMTDMDGTEDSSAKLEVTPSQVSIPSPGIERQDDIYSYKFMGERVNRFTIRTAVTPSSGIELGGSYMILGASDQGTTIQDLADGRDGFGVWMNRHSTGGGFQIILGNFRPSSTATDSFNTTYVADTTYYVEIERLQSRLGGVQVRVYSDPEYTTLIDTLIEQYNWAHYHYFSHGSYNTAVLGDRTMIGDFTAWDIVEWISCDDGWDKYNGYFYTTTGSIPFFSTESVGIGDTKILHRLGSPASTSLTAMVNATPYASIRHAPNKKIYFEVELTTGNPAVCYIGYATEKAEWSSNTHHAPGGGSDTGLSYNTVGGLNSYGNVQADWGDTYGEGDRIGVALDLTDAVNGNGKAWFSKNGVWQASGNPIAGLNPAKDDIDIVNGDTLVPSVAVRTPSTFTLKYEIPEMHYRPAGFGVLASPLLPIDWVEQA